MTWSKKVKMSACVSCCISTLENYGGALSHFEKGLSMTRSIASILCIRQIVKALKGQVGVNFLEAVGLCGTDGFFCGLESHPPAHPRAYQTLPKRAQHIFNLSDKRQFVNRLVINGLQMAQGVIRQLIKGDTAGCNAGCNAGCERIVTV